MMDGFFIERFEDAPEFLRRSYLPTAALESARIGAGYPSMFEAIDQWFVARKAGQVRFAIHMPAWS